MNSYSPEVQEKIRYIFGYQKMRNGYVHSRGLFKDGQIDGYKDLLKDDCGRKLDTVIQGRVDSGQLVDLIDLGCGSGKFLVDCKSYWRDKINCTGVTAANYAFPNRTMDESVKLRKELGIKIVSKKDIHDLSKVIPSGSVDVVTSVFTAMYLVDDWALIREMHRILRVGGEGFVNTFNLWMEKPLEDNKRLIKWFRENETIMIDSQPGGDQVYYQKRSEKLELPIYPTGLWERKLLYRPTF